MQRMGWVLFATAAALAACGGDTSTDGTRTPRGPQQPGMARAGAGGSSAAPPPGGMTDWGKPIQPMQGGGGAMKPVQTMDPNMCTTVTLNASRITPNVMLVVDGSQSMVIDSMTQMPAYYPPTQMVTTRWAAVRTA